MQGRGDDNPLIRTRQCCNLRDGSNECDNL